MLTDGELGAQAQGEAMTDADRDLVATVRASPWEVAHQPFVVALCDLAERLARERDEARRDAAAAGDWPDAREATALADARAARAERERDAALADLRLNASMLAHQCDLARVAETERDEARAEAAAAEAREAQLLEALVLVDRWLDSPPLRRIATSADLHGAGITDAEFAQYGKPALDALAAALALPAGRSALDAQLAEARREGARACVAAAREAAFGEAPRDATLLCRTHPWRPCRTCEDAAAQPVVNAVERAAAEVGAAGKETTP